MKRRLFKTMVAVLAIAAAATGPARAQSNSQVTDVMNREWTGRSGTSYGDWSGLTLTSDAVYAGNSAGGNSAIQLRSNIQNSGIVTTTSGGTVASVTVTWNSSTPNGRTLEVYGKHSAYSAASDLYGDNAGDRLGSIVYGTSTPLTIEGDYEYIGLRSMSGAMYLNEIQVVWNVAGSATPEPEPEPEPEPAVPHTVRFAAGNDGWQMQDVTASASAVAPAVLQNVMAGDSLVVTAPATLPGKVKSVKAVKYVAPAATVTTAPTATAAIIEANSTSALVNAGAANGGSMMYAVTTNAQPASTADFSATIPTAQGRTPGYYYVWYYAKADADHSDSEIAGPVSVTLAVMTTVTWNSTNVFNSAHMDDVLDEFYTDPLTYEGITISFSGDDASAFDVCDDESQIGSLTCFGDRGDSFTFTAPSGKKFCKIEIIDNEGIAFDDYGDWTLDARNHKIVWSGTAANAVTLSTVFTDADNLNSIVFTLIDD